MSSTPRSRTAPVPAGARGGPVSERCACCPNPSTHVARFGDEYGNVRLCESCKDQLVARARREGIRCNEHGILASFWSQLRREDPFALAVLVLTAVVILAFLVILAALILGGAQPSPPAYGIPA